MTEEAWNKDDWIKLAFAMKHIECDRNGNVFRKAGFNEGGGIIWKKVKLQIHKKSGRQYWNMTFRGKTKSVLVNRAMGLRFLPNPDNLAEVNHIDGVKAHNWVDTPERPTNLEWASRSEQEKHAFRTGLKATRGSSNSNAKLTANDVTSIRMRHCGGTSMRDLAKDYAVSGSTIRNIITNKTWKHL